MLALPARLALGSLLLAALGPSAPAQSPQTQKPCPNELVMTQEGKLPIILSAPHGGTKEVKDVPPRKGDGLEKGGSGFFAGRDGNTEELAIAISKALEKATGKKPYLVVAQFHRKYIDANRPPEIAYEDPKAKPTYDCYRDTLASYCKAVKSTHGRGLLLDVHGQGAIKDSIVRGTKDGKTVALLIERYGQKAHTGPKSFFGLLAENGCKVHPTDLADKEYASLNGGNIVQTYGSGDFGIDAIQLEFGGDFRDKDKLKDTAAKVAAAIVKYSALYLEKE